MDDREVADCVEDDHVDFGEDDRVDHVEFAGNGDVVVALNHLHVASL